MAIKQNFFDFNCRVEFLTSLHKQILFWFLLDQKNLKFHNNSALKINKQVIDNCANIIDN